MSYYHYYKNIYSAFLPIPIITTSMFGVITGVNYGIEQKDPIKRFSGMIEYTSLGIITGIMYPITLPLFAGYTLFQKQE